VPSFNYLFKKFELSPNDNDKLIQNTGSKKMESDIIVELKFIFVVLRKSGA